MPNAIGKIIRMVSVLLCELAQEVTGSPMMLAGTAPPGAWRLSATWATRATRPVEAATPVKTSLVRLSPYARLLASLPGDPSRDREATS
jgi:hypothetical protein